MNKMLIGYTTGVYDLFHIGHLNLLRKARSMCDKLVVGVTADKLVSYKHKKPVIPFVERIEIVQACMYVDLAIPQDSLDKIEARKKIKYDLLFVGDDWYQNPKWEEYDLTLNKMCVKIIYLPYTKNTSSTLINDTLEKIRNE